MEKKDGSRKVTGIFLFILLVLAQTASLLHWGKAKQNYFIDELFSMNYAQDFFAQREESRYFNYCSDVVLNEWMEARQVRRHLSVEPEESLTAFPLSVTVPRFVNGRNYHGFLNIAESILSPGTTGRRAGLALNLAAFWLLQTVFYLLLGRLGVKEVTRLLAVGFLGFTAAVAGLFVFIRFYLLTNLFLMTVYLLHLVMWQTRNKAAFAAAEAASFLLMLMSVRNSELALAVCGSLAVFFALGLLLRRRFAAAAAYAFPVLAGGFYYLSKNTSYIRLLTDLSGFADKGGTKATLAEHFFSTNWPDVEAYYRDNVHPAYADEVFGSDGLMTAFGIGMAVLLITVIIVRLIDRKDPGTAKKPGERMGFMLILAGVLAVYHVFMAVSRFEGLDNASRYLSFSMFLFIVLLWYAVDRLLDLLGDRKAVRWVFLAALLVFAADAGRMVYARETVPYLFTDDRETAENWREVSGVPQVVVRTDFNTFYESLGHIPEDTPLMYVDDGLAGTQELLPETFVYWMSRWRDPAGERELLTEWGYQATEVGKLFLSRIILFTREAQK